jgi:hypothetical protein
MIIRKEYVEKGARVENETMVTAVKKSFKHKSAINNFTKIFAFPGFKERFYPAMNELPLEKKNIYFMYKNNVFRIPSKYF